MIERLRHGLAAHAPQLAPPGAGAAAAVAVILHDAGPGARLLFIERARHDGDPWSGDLAFPGGRAECGDADGRHTAERETREEVGLDLAGAACLGRLDDHPARVLPMTVSAFVYEVTAAPPLQLSAEVNDAFWFPLERLTDAARRCHHVRERHGAVHRYPALDLLGPGRPPLWGVTYAFVQGLLGLAGVQLPAHASSPESP